MDVQAKNKYPRIKIVNHLPDLMTESDYHEHEKRKIRVRITVTKDGVEILSDSMYPNSAEKVMRQVSDDIERTLCG